MTKQALLLTGCTGFIGEYLLGYLLLRGVEVAALVRGDSSADAAARLDRLVARLEQRLGCTLSRPQCLWGDLHQPGLGLSAADRAWLSQHVGRVLHNAGNVEFHGRAGVAPRLTNVDGTRRLAETCRSAGIDDFHYVSTAYVCGDRSGTILESDLEAEQGFLSPYEESKYAAEVLLHGAGFPHLTVYRPAAVVGDFQTGYTKSFHGPYSYLRFTQIAQQRAGARPGERWRHPVRLALEGGELHHFVPVNWAAEAIVRLVADNRARGRTYHLTSTTPVTSATCERALADLFLYEGVQFVGRAGMPDGPRNEMEELFYAHLEPRYWRGDPRFDCRNVQAALGDLPCPELDVTALKRVFQFALDCRFGRSSSPDRCAFSRPCGT